MSKINKQSNLLKLNLRPIAKHDQNRMKMSSRASSGSTVYRTSGHRRVCSMPKVKIVPSIF